MNLRVRLNHARHQVIVDEGPMDHGFSPSDVPTSTYLAETTTSRFLPIDYEVEEFVEDYMRMIGDEILTNTG